MKKISMIMKKWKSFSKQGRSTTYSSLSPETKRDESWKDQRADDEGGQIVFVGSSRKRYAVSSKHLTHPLLNALINRSRQNAGGITVQCEVVLFDHLLWMLENADREMGDSMEELVELYAC